MRHKCKVTSQGKNFRLEIQIKNQDGSFRTGKLIATCPRHMIEHCGEFLSKAIRIMTKSNYSPALVFLVIDEPTGEMLEVDAYGFPLTSPDNRHHVFKDIIQFDVEKWCHDNGICISNFDIQPTHAWTVRLQDFPQTQIIEKANDEN